ncbi:DUF1822 family protein [Microcoleus sp. bin38.metabat.b11b12b14.051]|uniref:DUF1822 family protein n=1 Tax=Microcoleus sp. bin38.metabat.b11b12b14.051 TaxID=2742709 RepID=UPI0025D0CD08|nr:DUF1822 family protein [Microcoleus sp. bin38.metabat.b11b12b14.051]
MNDSNLWEIDSLSMPITQKAMQLARQFSGQQSHPQKQEQVYLNTLAVLAVRDYLTILSIETDLTQCDSWNPVIRLFADAADLYVKGLGKIECRPIKNRHLNSFPQPLESCPVPVEARTERIGYIAVEIDEEENEARLLGFSASAAAGELVLRQLHSLDDFLVHLEHLFEAKVDLRQWLVNVFMPDWQPFEAVVNPQPDAVPAEIIENPRPSRLRNWLNDVVEAGWQKIQQGKQSLEDLVFRDSRDTFAFRGGGSSGAESHFFDRKSSVYRLPEADVTRAKLIDLGMELGRTTVALLVAIAEESDRTMRVCVQLHPALGQRYLPPHTKLSLISDTGEILHEAESTMQNSCIVLKDFEVEPQESFSIKVALKNVSVTENFVV